MKRVLEKAAEDDFAAWLEVQKYKLYFPLGIWLAILWLRIRYGWDDKKERLK
jgi:hypothetical protein